MVILSQVFDQCGVILVTEAVGHRLDSRVLRGRMERLFGLREALLSVDEASVVELQLGEEGFANAFLALKTEGELPTALFCAHGSLGVHVVSELHRMGLRVPDDIFGGRLW